MFKLIGSVSLFIFFTKLNINSKVINLLASTTLSVYFIHVDYSIRVLIYNKILKCQNYYESNLFIIHIILSIILIFIISAFISIILKVIFNKISIWKKYGVLLWNKLIDMFIKIFNDILYILDFVNKKIFPKPSIRTIDETIDYIIKNQASISRYGDGELKLMNNKSIFFQNHSEELSNRLKEIAKSSCKNHIVCIPDIFADLTIYDEEPYEYWKLHVAKTRRLWYSILNRDKQYFNSFISRCYYMYKDKSKSREWFKKIKLIWNNREVVIIEGEKSRLGIGNDLLNNCRSIERILCPVKNSFSKYEEILEQAQKIDKNKLILLALGPTATVLAYDLCKLGYQAVDIGHLDIEYEWFLMGATKKIKVKNKFIGEAKGGTEVGELKDEVYINQIIASIE